MELSRASIAIFYFDLSIFHRFITKSSQYVFSADYYNLIILVHLHNSVIIGLQIGTLYYVLNTRLFVRYGTYNAMK